MAESRPVQRLHNPLADSIVTKLFDAFHLYICMCLSGELVGNVLLGGALCLAGQVLVVYARLFARENRALLPHSMQARSIGIFIASVALLALLLFLYPALAESAHFPRLITAVLILIIRQGSTTVAAMHLSGLRRALLLALIHAALSAGALLLVDPYIAPGPMGDISTMVIATGVGLLARQIVSTQPGTQYQASRSDADRLQQVSAYRIYNRMVSSSIVALNLALITYICTMDLGSGISMIDRFWNLVVWLVLVFGVTYIGLVFFRRRGLTRYDKPTVFVAGAIMLSIAITGTYNEWFTGWGTLPGYFLWGVGLACILSIIVSMGADMQAVLELDMTEEELTGYRDNTLAVVDLSLTLSMLLVLVMLTLMAFLSEGAAAAYRRLPLVRFMMDTMSSWPVIVIGGALIYALMQPLNSDYAKKLARFRAQQRKGEANPALETRLQFMLVKQTKRVLPSILRAVIRPLMPCRVHGKEHVDTEHGPVVFVCNHLEIYGPLITNLHLPFYFRSWIISSMLDRDVIYDQLEGGINVVFRWAPARMREWIRRLAARIIPHILQSLDPIPVYRGTMREVIKTIQLTVDAMECEDNILLFPENPGNENYKEIGVSQFYSGFVSIGAEYYKRTGLSTTFYPMYVDKQKRTLTIGEGIVYLPENGSRKEKARIVDALHTWMSGQGEAGK